MRRAADALKSGDEALCSSGMMLEPSFELGTTGNEGLPNLRFSFGTHAELAEFLRAHPRIEFLDVCFTDPLGRWHHCTVSSKYVTEKTLAAGFGFGSCAIQMFENVANSEAVLVPDPTTCFLDPFAAFPTMHVTASVFRANGEVYEKCPRQILARALKVMRDSEIADEAVLGPEAEFFLFNSSRFSVEPNHMLFQLDGSEAYWNYSKRESKDAPENLGHRAVLKDAYMCSRPLDKSADMRSEMILVLEQLGVRTEKHHHEVATCQMEINVRATHGMEAVDNLQILKYTIKNVAEKKGKTATFMPKPLANDNGSGMHCNQSLWKDGKNLFFDETSKFEQLSDLALYYTAGILTHCRALMAITCPTTNSYCRMVANYDAPLHITYSAANRTAVVRIPTYTSAKAKRIEFRAPDASCCLYLAYAAMLLAGLDGIKRKLELPPMGEGVLTEAGNVSAKEVEKCPLSLSEALDALEADHEFLTRDGVFPEELIRSFIAYKRAECEVLRAYPHPREFMLYYSC